MEQGEVYKLHMEQSSTKNLKAFKVSYEVILLFLLYFFLDIPCVIKKKVVQKEKVKTQIWVWTSIQWHSFIKHDHDYKANPCIR